MTKPEFALTLHEVCEVLGMNPNTFTQSLHPLLVEAGDAKFAGTAWVYRAEYMWQWKLYITTRKNLIEAKVWKSKHPYSIEDMEHISIEGWYEEYQPQGFRDDALA